MSMQFYAAYASPKHSLGCLGLCNVPLNDVPPSAHAPCSGVKKGSRDSAAGTATVSASLGDSADIIINCCPGCHVVADDDQHDMI